MSPVPRPAILIHRLDGGWRADVPARDLSLHARNLVGIFAQLRVLTDPATAAIRFRTGDPDLDQLIAEVRAACREAEAAGAKLRTLTGRLLARRDRLPIRDLAVLVGKSHQRVAQLRDQAPG